MYIRNFLTFYLIQSRLPYEMCIKLLLLLLLLPVKKTRPCWYDRNSRIKNKLLYNVICRTLQPFERERISSTFSTLATTFSCGGEGADIFVLCFFFYLYSTSICNHNLIEADRRARMERGTLIFTNKVCYVLHHKPIVWGLPLFIFQSSQDWNRVKVKQIRWEVTIENDTHWNRGDPEPPMWVGAKINWDVWSGRKAGFVFFSEMNCLNDYWLEIIYRSPQIHLNISGFK